MKIEYRFKQKTPLYVIYEIFGFGITTQTMYVNKINPTQIDEDNWTIDYNLVGMFVNIDINENVIDTGKPIAQDSYKVWIFSDNLVFQRFLKENFDFS